MDWSKLKPYQERQFVPQDANLTNKNVVVDLYQQLIDLSVASAADLEDLVLKRSELDAALGQTGSILYIEMTCQTDDPQKAQAYQNFMETVTPAVKPLNDQLNHKYVQARNEFDLDDERYLVYDREIKKDIELFKEENVPLQTEIQKLSQEYQTICGAMTVEFEGEEKTMPQMSKYLLESDRDLREQAWKAIAQRRFQDAEKLDDVFDQMLKLRHQVAVNAGFKNFRDYQFQAYHRFDYTPDDCKTYHKVVEELLVPLSKLMMQKRQEQMQVDSLRPWDVAVDPLNRAPLKPFNEVDELLNKSLTIFQKTDDTLGEWFSQMKAMGFLDLASRKGKAPGGYQSTLQEARKPFIFMNSVGLDRDVRTLLHEAGHAFHALACAQDPICDYRHAPMEFCEVASMAMELLAGEYLDEFYSEDDFNRSRFEHLEDIIQTLIWVAQVDAFQHWIYENPTHTAQERQEYWVSLAKRFGTGLIDHSGLEQFQRTVWHRQLHIFEVPFYYIEYAIAQLGALQLWKLSKEDRPQALEKYKQALSLGGAQPLPDLYTACGIKFDFSKNTIAPLVSMVKEEMKVLANA